MAHIKVENGFDYQLSYTFGIGGWHTLIFDNGYEMRCYAYNLWKTYHERNGFGIVCYRMCVMATDQALDLGIETDNVPLVLPRTHW